MEYSNAQNSYTSLTPSSGTARDCPHRSVTRPGQTPPAREGLPEVGHCCDTTRSGNEVPACAFQDFWQDGTGFGSAEQSMVGDGMCPCTPRPRSGSDA